MPLEIRVSNTERYLSAKMSGRATVADFRQMLDVLLEETMRLSSTRLLIDLVGVEEHFRIDEHVVVSEQAAANFNHLEKIASLVPPGRKKGTTEQAAQKRGVVLRTFMSEADAIAWLEA